MSNTCIDKFWSKVNVAFYIANSAHCSEISNRHFYNTILMCLIIRHKIKYM